MNWLVITLTSRKQTSNSFSEETGESGEMVTSFFLLSVPGLNTIQKKKKLVIILVISSFSGILTLGLAIWFQFWKKRRMGTGMHTYRPWWFYWKPCGSALKAASKLLSHLTDQESKKENLELPLFDLPTIATATNNFSNTNKIGAGGFGSVYKVCALLCIIASW